MLIRYSCMILAVLGISINASGIGPAQSDSIATPPAFYVIDEWPEIAALASSQEEKHLSPQAVSIRHLSKFHDGRFNPSESFLANPSPLEWPLVFADQSPDARQFRIEVEALFDQCALDYRRILPTTDQEGHDTLIAAIARHMPVLLNAPGAPIVYGYDTREPDVWWWVDSGSRPFIVLESDRVRNYVLWADDPAAGLMWIVNGTRVVEVSLPEVGDEQFELLRTVSRSVDGDPDNGIKPYPLSLVDMRKRLTTSDSLVPLRMPVDSTDPIGVRRAAAARQRVHAALVELTPHIVDTALSGPLRLAQYFYLSSVDSFEQLEEVFYGTDPAKAYAELLIAWVDESRRRRATQLLTDILTVERKALEAVNRALAIQDSGKQ